MSRLIKVLVVAVSVVAIAAPAAAGDFNPLRTVQEAVDLGVDTARRAVDLGLETAEEAVDVEKDVVTADNCERGERYRDSEGHWHTCR